MKQLNHILLAVLLMFCASLGSAQNVSHVMATQEGKKVIITYDLDKTANIQVRVSTDGGHIYGMPLEKVIGHVGRRVPAGKNRTIVWNVLEEKEQLVGDNIVFQVEAEPVRLPKQKTYSNDWYIFGLANVSLPVTEMTTIPFDFSNLSYGITIGMYKRVGWYISAMSNFNFKGAYHPFTDGDYELTGETRFSRISATAGIVVNTCKPLSLYAGVGYGYRSLNCKVETEEWYSYPKRTFSGVDVELGLLFNLKGFSLSAGAITTNFKYLELKMGIGVCLKYKNK